MPVRALFSSFLLALLLLAGVNAAAEAKAPTAKVALGAKPKQAKAARYTAPCANTDLVPDAGNLVQIRAALVCLHNQVRAQNGLRVLRENGALAVAAAGHSNDMVTRSYFDHATPEGGTFVDRIITAGYAKRNDGWTLGENLAWGTGDLSTPAGLMRSWMASPGHRHNILKGSYREVGFGLRIGTPTGGDSGLTVSAEFGARLG